MKSSKIIKTMSLLLAMFSFLLSGCVGADTSSTSSSSYDNTSQTSESTIEESSLTDDTSSQSEEDSGSEDSSIEDSGSQESSVEEESTTPEHVHVYDTNNIEWNWTGYEYATATFTCVDGDDTQVIDATITDEVTTDPACETEGVRTYTATVAFEGETYTDRKTQSVEQTGHSWDISKIEWAWVGYTAATATFTCLNDSTHTETVNASVSLTESISSSCTEEGSNTYVATVEFEGGTYTDAKTEVIDANGHTYDMQYDDDGHWEVCSECGYISEKEEHYVEYGKCIGCGYAVPEADMSDYVVSDFADGILSMHLSETGVLKKELTFPSEYEGETVRRFLFDSYSDNGDVDGTVERINIPAETEGMYIFTADSLREIRVDKANTSLSSSEGVLFSKDMTELMYYPVNKPGFDYVIPDTVQTIMSNAIWPNNLRKLTIPSSVQTIEDYAIWASIPIIELYNYSSIEITASEYTEGSGYSTCDYGYIYNVYTDPETESRITQEGDYAFYTDAGNNVWLLGEYSGTDGELTLPEKEGGYSVFGYAFYERDITSVIMPEGVTSIGNYAFYRCLSLKTVSLPSSLTSIGIFAFQSCSALENVTLPASLVSIGRNAFNGCTSFTSIDIPDSVTSIGLYAFSGCSSLETVTIGDSLASVPLGAFWHCTSLKSIVISGNVTSIGDYAFNDTPALEYIFWEGSEYTLSFSFPYGTIYCYSETEPTSEGNWWHYVDGVPTVWETTTATE